MTPEETARLKALAQAAKDAELRCDGEMIRTWREYEEAARPQAVLDLIADVETAHKDIHETGRLGLLAVEELEARIAALESALREIDGLSDGYGRRGLYEQAFNMALKITRGALAGEKL